MDRGHFGHGRVILDNWILSKDNNRHIDWGHFEMLTCSYAFTFKKISSQINYLTRLKEFIKSVSKITHFFRINFFGMS